MSGGSEKRRDIRYAARIVARVVRKTDSVELLTQEVSFRGAFLRTDAPLGMRQLLKVEFTLPNGAAVAAHAMVVHVVEPGSTVDPVPGMGIQFWGSVDGGKAWEAFIHELRRSEAAGLPKARLTDKVRRASERVRLAIEVVLDGRRAMTRDISHGGLAVRTDAPMAVGMRASLDLAAPDGGALSVEVVVRRRIDEPGFRGLGVEFVDVTPDKHRAIVAFVRDHSAPDDAIYVAEGDPNLH